MTMGKNLVKPKSSPKSRSKIQGQNPKSEVQRKGTGTGTDTIILQATTNNFSHLKCQYSDGKRPSMTFHDLP